MLIDEVDSSSNNLLFLGFLAVLRKKYLAQAEEIDISFHSVILVGVYDVKTLKLKIRPDNNRKYNSPWNIAADFKVKMGFTILQIEAMLKDYTIERSITMNTRQIAQELEYFTSGYPFLVTKICQIIDENILPNKQENRWEKRDILTAIKKMTYIENPNFESLIKNLENNADLHQLLEKMLLDRQRFAFNIYNPTIKKGVQFGVFKNGNGLNIHNKIYEQTIYDYMSSKLEISRSMEKYNFREQFIGSNNSLDVEKNTAQISAIYERTV